MTRQEARNHINRLLDRIAPPPLSEQESRDLLERTLLVRFDGRHVRLDEFYDADQH